MTRLLTSAVLALALVALSRPASAQGGRGLFDPGASGHPTQVLSTNPFGVAVRYFNGEYETRVASGLTAGIGASHLLESVGIGPYTNSDVFLRYYPGGRALHGVSVGLKAGLTTVGSDGLAVGAGFDLNASHWVNDRVVMSAGVGLKRVFNGADTFTLPTIRIINIGIGF